MKLILCLISLIIIGIVVGQETMSPRDAIRSMFTECKTKTGATDVELINVKRHKIPETRNEQCLLACIEKKRGTINADNKINITRIKETLEPIRKFNYAMYNDTIKATEECVALEKPESDECVAAKNFAACIYPKTHMGGENSMHAMLRKSIEDCQNKTGANEDEVKTAMRHQTPKTKNEACMLACMQKKSGFLTSDNKIDLDEIKNHFSWMNVRNGERYNRIIKMYEECKNEETNEKDECEAARKFAECIIPKQATKVH